MLLPLTLASTLLAVPATLGTAQLEKEFEGQRRLHSKSAALPWTRRALAVLLPVKCNGQARAEATPVASSAESAAAAVLLRYGAPAEQGRVTVEVVDLASLVPEELRVRLESLVAELPGPRVESYRPVPRSPGFIHAPDGTTPARAAVLVGGRFLVTAAGDAGLAPRVFRSCLGSVNWVAIRRTVRPSAGKRQR